MANSRPSKFLDVVRPRRCAACRARRDRHRARFASRSASRAAAVATGSFRMRGRPAAHESQNRQSHATGGPRPNGQASRARQHRAAAHHGVRLAAFGQQRSAASSLYGIALYFFLFAPQRAAPLASLSCAWRSASAPRARDRFRQILSFATTIHDRVYLINGQFELFNIYRRGRGPGACASRRAAAAPCCWAPIWAASR